MSSWLRSLSLKGSSLELSLKDLFCNESGKISLRREKFISEMSWRSAHPSPFSISRKFRFYQIQSLRQWKSNGTYERFVANRPILRAVSQLGLMLVELPHVDQTIGQLLDRPDLAVLALPHHLHGWLAQQSALLQVQCTHRQMFLDLR